MDNKERNEIILKTVCEMLEKMNHEVDKAFVEDLEDGDDQVLVGVTVADPSGLIGFRGRNLASIQLILSLVVKNKLDKWVRVLLDVNGYRSEQKERLIRMARSLATKVKETGVPVEMAAMSSYERRICHMAIADMDVVSESEGEGEDRHIVIKSKN